MIWLNATVSDAFASAMFFSFPFFRWNRALPSGNQNQNKSEHSQWFFSVKIYTGYRVDRFTFLDCFLAKFASSLLQLGAGLSSGGEAYVGVKHLRRRPDIPLKSKGRVCLAMRPLNCAVLFQHNEFVF